jgi:hypothetical protein
MGRITGQNGRNLEELAEKGIVKAGRIGREFYRTLPFLPAFLSAHNALME